jgi:hypothetical protein
MAKKYIYVPGLARHDKTSSETPFTTKVKNTFGWLFKNTGAHQRWSDSFMDGAVKSLLAQSAEGLDCTVNLNWIQISADDRKHTSKALKVMGAAQDNMLTKKAGDKLVGAKGKDAQGNVIKIPGKSQGPKDLDYDEVQQPMCMAAEFLAQLMPPPPAVPKQGAPEPIPARTSEKGALGELQKDDVLYIVGHGNQRGGTMTFKCPPPESHLVRDKGSKQPGCETQEHQEKWYIDPHTLASLLLAEGLPKTHKMLELVMCYGAGMNLADEQVVQPYAQRLAGALTAFGYGKIQVRSAKGLVVGPTLAVNPTLTPKDGKLIINTKTGDVKPGDSGYGKLFQTFKGK